MVVAFLGRLAELFIRVLGGPIVGNALGDIIKSLTQSFVQAIRNTRESTNKQLDSFATFLKESINAPIDKLQGMLGQLGEKASTGTDYLTQINDVFDTLSDTILGVKKNAEETTNPLETLKKLLSEDNLQKALSGVNGLFGKLKGLLGENQLQKNVKDTNERFGGTKSIMSSLKDVLKKLNPKLERFVRALRRLKIPKIPSIKDIEEKVKGAIEGAKGVLFGEPKKTYGVRDFIITKSGQVLQTAPDDYIFGTKNPLGRQTNNITINVSVKDGRDFVNNIDRYLQEAEERLRNRRLGAWGVYR